METTFIVFRPFAWLKSLWDSWMHNRKVNADRRAAEKKIEEDKTRLVMIKEEIARLRSKIENKSTTGNAKSMAQSKLEEEVAARDSLVLSITNSELEIDRFVKRPAPKLTDYVRFDILGIAQATWHRVVKPVGIFIARFGYLFIIGGYLVAHYGYGVSVAVLMPYFWTAAMTWAVVSVVYNFAVWQSTEVKVVPITVDNTTSEPVLEKDLVSGTVAA